MNRRPPRILLCLLLLCSMLLSPTVTYAKTDLSTTAEGVESAIKSTASYLMKTFPEPAISSTGGEWTILGLARAPFDISGRTDYLNKYYSNAASELLEKQGVLTSVKYTEYSRVILAMQATGKDPRAVSGYDLITKLLDFEKVKKQGLNGPVYALMALDSGGYTLPQTDESGTITTLTTKQGLLDYILDRELEGGGFALSSTETKADPDVTAMVLQALAAHKNEPDAAAAIARAVPVLSASVGTGGGIVFSGTETAESTAQTVLALTALGLNPETDSRFQITAADGTKTGLIAALLSYRKTDGSFCHIKGGNTDPMATEQAFLALVSYSRLLVGTYHVTINGEELAFDQAPVLQNGRLLVPMSAIFRALGAEVSWDGATKSVTALSESNLADAHTIVLAIGSAKAKIDGTEVTLDAPAVIINGRTMVPLRFVAEALEADVIWDAATKTAEITKE